MTIKTKSLLPATCIYKYLTITPGYDILTATGANPPVKKYMNTKFSWSALFSSKTVWFNIIITILGIVAGLQGVNSFDQYAEAFIVITLVGNVILKIWFNTTAIASTPTV